MHVVDEAGIGLRTIFTVVSIVAALANLPLFSRYEVWWVPVSHVHSPLVQVIAGPCCFH
jgi:hypothetical protein